MHHLGVTQSASVPFYLLLKEHSALFPLLLAAARPRAHTIAHTVSFLGTTRSCSNPRSRQVPLGIGLRMRLLEVLKTSGQHRQLS